jgi:hypothetical protein
MPRQSLELTKNLTEGRQCAVFYCRREALKMMEDQKYDKIISDDSTVERV